MRTALLTLVATLAFGGTGRGESLIDDTEGRADLRELLKLSRKVWGEENGLETFDSLLRRHGISPEIGGVVSGSGIGFGFAHTLWSNADAAVRWGAIATSEGYWQVALVHETELGESGRFRLKSGLLHRDLAQEDFFGLGVQTSRADHTDYRLRETAAGSELDVALSETVGLRVGGDVRRMRIGTGSNDAFPAPLSASGYGESFTYATFGASLFWDTRDHPGYPRRGSFVLGGARHFQGLGSGDPGFRRFEVELQNALPLPGHDHAIVSRFRADWLDHRSDARIPFFFTRGLGGAHTLRGFPLNRFRGEDLIAATIEYRSAILPGKLDGVAFWDMGGVYGGLSELSFGSLSHSYGAGVRVLTGARVLLRLEVARGAEGTRFLISFSKPF